jgi:hypothetical protein
MRQPLGHAEVFRVIDRGFRSQRLAQLVVILSFRVRQSRDLRRPVMDSVADGTLAG